MLTAHYRQNCDPIRPHSSLGYRPPPPILFAQPIAMHLGLTLPVV